MNQPPAANIDPRLLAQVRAIVASCGGWNAESQRQVVLLLHSAGVPADQLPSIVARAVQAEAGEPERENAAPPASPVRPPAAGPRPPAPSQPPPRPAESVIFNHMPTPDQDDPSRRIIRQAVWIFGGLTFAMIVVGVVGLVILSVSRGRPTPPPPPPAAPKTLPDVLAKRPPSPAPTIPSPQATAIPVDPGDATGAIRLLSSAIDEAALDPQVAVTTFSQGFSAAARLWPRFTPDQLTAAVNACVDFFHRVKADPASSAAAVRALAAANSQEMSPTAMSPRVWSSGIAARLQSESDFPASLVEDLRASVGVIHAGGTGIDAFRAGAVQAAADLARILAPQSTPASVWTSWCGAVDAAAPDEEVANRLKLTALERLLISGPDPARDEATAASVGRLVVSITWRSQDASRRAVLRWFDSAEVTPSDLRAVTQALARESAAAADATMVLSSNASASDREALRDRFASLWAVGGGAGAREEAVAALAAALEEFSSVSGAPTRRDSLSRAIDLMRLNYAAELIRAGQHDTSLIVARGARAGLETVPSLQTTPGADESESERWVVEYLGSEQNPAARLSLITQARAERFTPAAAQVLLREATRGGVQALRSAARNVLLRASSAPVFVLAMIEELPTMPLTGDNADLASVLAGVDDLPGLRDPAWRPAARRALVARAIQLLSRDEESIVIDQLLLKAAEAMEQRIALMRAAQPAESAPPLGDAGAALCDLWRERALRVAGSGRTTLADIDARRAARRDLADGPLQRFVAEQASTLEYAARTFDAEAPGRASLIDAVLQRYEDAARAAVGVIDQIAVGEAAMAALWSIRFGGGDA